MLSPVTRLTVSFLSPPRHTQNPHLYQTDSHCYNPGTGPPPPASSVCLINQHLPLRPQAVHPVLSINQCGVPTCVQTNRGSVCGASQQIGVPHNNQSVLGSRLIPTPSGRTQQSYKTQHLLTTGTPGVARKQSGYSRRLRKPITKDILQRLLQILSRPTSTWCSQERAMLAAALCLGFYGFLRGGELMPSSENTFNPRTSLTAADINITSGCLQFSIKRSKTDQLGKGHTITLYKSDTDLCPVYLIQRYLQVSRPSPDQPLLLHCNGRPLYLHQFRAMLRKLLGMAKLQPQEFNTHSLRIGAATSAAEEGVPTRTIKRLGRWRSRAYRLYIRNY